DAEGRLLLAGYVDGSAQLWDRATRKPLGPPVLQSRPIAAVAFLPDGRSFLTTAQDGDTRRWPLPAATEEPCDLLGLRLQVRTGVEMGEGQAVVPMRQAVWEQRRAELARREGAAAGAIGDREFHEARARDAEQDGAWWAARWHLDRLIPAQE